MIRVFLCVLVLVGTARATDWSGYSSDTTTVAYQLGEDVQAPDVPPPPVADPDQALDRYNPAPVPDEPSCAARAVEPTCAAPVRQVQCVQQVQCVRVQRVQVQCVQPVQQVECAQTECVQAVRVRQGLCARAHARRASRRAVGYASACATAAVHYAEPTCGG